MSSVTLKELEDLKMVIESLTDKQQVEVLRILKTHGVKLNNTKMGIFVNLTPLSLLVVREIQQKVRFINDREFMINSIEKQKEDYKNNLTANDL